MNQHRVRFGVGECSAGCQLFAAAVIAGCSGVTAVSEQPPDVAAPAEQRTTPDVLLSFRSHTLADDGVTEVAVTEGQIRSLPGYPASLSITYCDSSDVQRLAIAVTKDAGVSCATVSLAAGGELGSTCDNGAPLEVALPDRSPPTTLWLRVN
jgi:hypothetical protein